MAINSIYFEYFGIFSFENIYKWKVCAVAIRGISFWNFLDFSFDFFYFLQTNWGSFENAFGLVFFKNILTSGRYARWPLGGFLFQGVTINKHSKGRLGKQKKTTTTSKKKNQLVGEAVIG